MSRSAERRRQGTLPTPSTSTAATEKRRQLLDAIYSGKPFKAALRDLNLTSNQVWGLTKTDEEWSAALDAALMVTRRDDLQHGTTSAYVRGCVCRECRRTSALGWRDNLSSSPRNELPAPMD